jgi:hypothetical protein
MRNRESCGVSQASLAAGRSQAALLSLSRRHAFTRDSMSRARFVLENAPKFGDALAGCFNQVRFASSNSAWK